MKLLIVDDEDIILRGLKKIVSSYDETIQIKTAGNGFLAIKEAERFKPDLMITDISMPEMSGLELIEQMKRKDLCARFIILTGYSEFEYVRTALRFHALDYLLKPVNKEELLNQVRAVQEEMQKEEKASEQQMLGLIREMILFDAPKEELLLDEALLARMFPLPYYLITVWQLQGRMEASAAEKIERLMRSESRNVHRFWLHSRLQMVYLINLRDNAQQPFQTERFRRPLLQLLEGERSLSGFGISTARRGIGELHTGYQEALRFLYFDRYAHSAEQIGVRYTQSAWHYEAVKRVFSAEDEERFTREMEVYRQEMRSLLPPAGAPLSGIYPMIESDLRTYLDEIGLPREERLTLVITAAGNARTYESIDMLLSQTDRAFAEVWQRIMKMRKESSYSDKVERMLTYIRTNYRNNLSLDETAQQTGLHPNYASTIFKRETGQSFVGYLNNLRVEKAKEMIQKNAEMTFRKIAESVGYESTDYFIKVFKKLCGETPGEYRRRTES